MRKENKGKRLHIFPIVLGIYAAFLGSGLLLMGIFQIKEGIGLIRALIGLGMACLGLYGIWDGVRDYIRPEEGAETPPARQLILTDTSGAKSSNVTPELLRKQMDILVESEDPRRFEIQILPPILAGEYGLLKQISCIYHGNIILVAYLEMPKDGYQILQKSMEPEEAEEWLGRLLAGDADFSGWGTVAPAAGQDDEEDWQDEDDAPEEEPVGGTEGAEDEQETLWRQRLAGQRGLSYWHMLLVIFGESWHDEHKFFTGRDLELAVEGVQEGKYRKAVLEWGYEVFYIFPGQESGLMVTWRANAAGKGKQRFLAREGTANQVKFWLVHYLNDGFFEEMGGWEDVTAKVEKEWKKHGKVF